MVKYVANQASGNGAALGEEAQSSPLTRNGEDGRSPQEAQRWERNSREVAVSRVNLRKHT